MLRYKEEISFNGTTRIASRTNEHRGQLRV